MPGYISTRETFMRPPLVAAEEAQDSTLGTIEKLGKATLNIQFKTWIDRLGRLVLHIRDSVGNTKLVLRGTVAIRVMWDIRAHAVLVSMEYNPPRYLDFRYLNTDFMFRMYFVFGAAGMG